MAEDRSNERAIRVEKGSFWESLKRFFTARETRMVVGILLLLFSVIALLSYVSFLFTGTYDQDILTLDRAGRLANREAIKNMLGLPGAMLARFMIDGSFGFVSILLVFMLTIYALRMMHVLKEIRGVLLFCGGSFWVLWGSVVLGFAHNMVHQMGVFRWGGAFGEAASRWLVSYVNTTGAILILLALLVIFLIVTDPRFIDRCKAFGAWVANFFSRKSREPRIPSETSEPSEEVTIEIPIPEDSEYSEDSDKS
ncbi:MAG: DNA translocase FtsK 4TM domain-containing protein, partial [Paludibacteraceae bacterium]|nr:DNA translocase FtsK 4TM domain-containing protein [Paludibacteraceae bacterium]